MSEPSLETSLETLNLTGQHQPSISNTSTGDDLDKILAGFDSFTQTTVDAITAAFDPQNSDDQLDINIMINPSDNYIDSATLLETQFSSISFDSNNNNNNDLLELLESCQKQEPTEHETPVQQQSCFIECYDTTNFYPTGPGYTSLSSVPVGSSPVEPKVEDEVQAYISQQYELYQTASKTKRSKNHRTSRTTNVGPVEYIMHSGDCEPYTTTIEMQTDYAYEQQQLEYDTADSKKIQIRCQPRSKFRPRTQNESKISSHYLRCEDGVKPEYPTISIPDTWFFQSDVNLIEVALVGLDKQPHPYSLYNKSSSDTYEDNVLIFKQGDPNVLYFRLTNEDFQNGYKTFMLELIKSKQDDVITKELIRSRQLEHSILRFTRIYQVGKGNFQRDEGSTEYSSVMSEAYGDVDVEHMGPRFGPMSGQEMVYMVLKGRILKNDLKIEIIENTFGWNYNIENFTKNGNVVYFIIPPFPYSHLQCETVKANIIVYYKGEELFQSPYLYKESLDRDLAELNLNDPRPTTIASSSMSNNFDPFNFLTATGVRANTSTRKTSATKRPKRLSK